MDHFICSHIADYIYDFGPLPDLYVGLSVLVCDVEHTSLHVGLCSVLCLFGQCPCLCTICHSWQHTGVLHLSLQADGKVAFEDIPVFGECRPVCHDYSLYMLVFLSLYVILSTLLSILVCAAASLFCACLVSVHVSAPYAIASSTLEFYTCLFRQTAMLLLKISRCLAYAAQPAMIRRCISLFRFFSLRL